jgi:hypothetical protein
VRRLWATTIGDRRIGFHRTHTPLRKWFVAASWMAQDKRSVAALFLTREFDLRYDTRPADRAQTPPRAERTAGIRAHRPSGDRRELLRWPRQPAEPGRGLADPNKSLMAIAVETVPASPRQGNGIRRAASLPACPHRRPAFGERSKSRRLRP